MPVKPWRRGCCFLAAEYRAIASSTGEGFAHGANLPIEIIQAAFIDAIVSRARKNLDHE
jgi:hypothetical protein